MNRSARFLLALCLLIAAPAAVWAQGASKDFPNDKPGPSNVGAGDSGKMSIRAVFKMTPKVETGVINLFGPEAGEEVAVTGSNRLCNDALAKGYTVTGIKGIAACADTSCCNALSTEFQSITCTIGGTGFSLSRNQSDVKFNIGPIGAGQVVNSLNHNSNAGNTIGTDPLPIFLIRVDKAGMDGFVDFAVSHTQGGVNPRTFFVDTTGLNDLDLHKAIKNGIEALGLGLTAIVHPARQASSHSHSDESINGHFVRIPNALSKGVLQIDAGGLEGQDIVVETAVFRGKPVPAVGSEGIVFLTLLLVLTGAWMVYRRHREA